MITFEYCSQSKDQKFNLYLCMISVQKVSSHCQYLKSQPCGIDVTCQPLRGDPTVYAWTIILFWGYSVKNEMYWGYRTVWLSSTMAELQLIHLSTSKLQSKKIVGMNIAATCFTRSSIKIFQTLVYGIFRSSNFGNASAIFATASSWDIPNGWKFSSQTLCSTTSTKPVHMCSTRQCVE